MNFLLTISSLVLAVDESNAVIENTVTKPIDWLSWTGWIIGALGLIIAVVQIYQAKKLQKEREKEREAERFLFKIAEQHIDKSIKNEEIADLEKKVNQMKSAIQDEIPKEAQKIALKNIIDNETQLISESYTKLVAMKEKLQELTGENTIDNDVLMKNVYKQISPTYSQRRNQQAFSNSFIVISVISSLIGVLIPYDYSRFILFAVMVVQLTLAIMQIRGYIKNNYSKKDRDNLIRVFTPVAALVCSLFSILIILQVTLGGRLYSSFREPGTLGTFIVFFVLHYALMAIYIFKIRKKLALKIFWIILLLFTLPALALMILEMTSSWIDWQMLIPFSLLLVAETIFNLFLAVNTYKIYKKIKT